jgi:hypothetical protein
MYKGWRSHKVKQSKPFLPYLCEGMSPRFRIWSIARWLGQSRSCPGSKIRRHAKSAQCKSSLGRGGRYFSGQATETPLFPRPVFIAYFTSSIRLSALHNFPPFTHQKVDMMTPCLTHQDETSILVVLED